MNPSIKRIDIVITPKSSGLDWIAFGNYVLSTYDNTQYEYSADEGDDLHYVFYGLLEDPVVNYFMDQVCYEGSDYPADIAVSVTVIPSEQWKEIAEDHMLDVDIFTDSEERLGR